MFETEGSFCCCFSAITVITCYMSRLAPNCNLVLLTSGNTSMCRLLPQVPDVAV